MLRLSIFVVLYSVAVAVVAAPTARWLSDPVSDRAIPDVLPPDWQGAAGSALHLSMTPGEHRGASFLIVAGPALSDVLPEPLPLVGPEDEQIVATQTDIRIVKHWYQAARGARTENLTPRLIPELLLKDDALVIVEGKKNYLQLTNGELMDISQRGASRERGVIPVELMPVRDAAELQPVAIAEGHNRQYWVTFSVPEDTPAGNYRGSIQVNAGKEAFAELAIELEVLPFELAPSMLVYSIFHKAKLDDKQPEGSVSSELRSNEQYRAELDNMVAHGVTQPNLYQRYNSPEFERALELRQAAGVEQQELFLIGLPAVPGSNGPVPFGFENHVRDTRKKVAKYGVEQLYVWGRDEAKADRLLEQKPVWAFSRELGAKLFVAGYHTTAATGPGNFDLMGPLHDTFVAINPATRGEAERWHSIGKRILSYQNPTGGMERPLTFRQTHGLFLWQMNYDGAMPYAYADSFGNGWNDFDHAKYRDHNFVYPTIDGVIDTLQWEGLREGINDVRYLSTLMEAMEQSDNAALVEEISAWLARLKEQPLARIDFDAVRNTFIGYILALTTNIAEVQSEAAVPAQLAEPLQFVPGYAEMTYVEFSTAERTAVELRYGSSADVSAGSVQSSALMYRHQLALPAMATDKPLFVQLVIEGAATDVLELPRADNLSMQVDLTQTAGIDLLDIELSSASLASTFVDVNNSLLGWWRFSETQGEEAASIAGDASPLELSGDTRWGAGYMGGGLQLDGSGDFAYASDFDTKEGEPVTIEAWVRFNQFALERGVRQGIFTGLYQHQVNNHFYLHGKKALFEVSSLLRVGVWHHIVLTFTRNTASAVLYIDGQPVPVSAQREDELMEPLDGFAVGRSSGFFGGLLAGGTTQFDGAIDEVRVWNRVLSDAEVNAAFGQTSGRYRLAYPTTKNAPPIYKVIGVNLAGASVEETLRP